MSLIESIEDPDEMPHFVSLLFAQKYLFTGIQPTKGLIIDFFPFLIFRIHVRGAQQLVFYGLPQYPHFYSEVCNMLHDVKKSSTITEQTCTVLYSKYEVLRLAEIVGTDRAGQMVKSGKSVHMFVTGEDG